MEDRNKRVSFWSDQGSGDYGRREYQGLGSTASGVRSGESEL